MLLASLLKERDALDDIPVKDMITRAVGFVCREGPTTDQDRREEDSASTPSPSPSPSPRW